jgi:uncharacterized membrane protein YphA (DoxX/SURF4 family)
MPEVLSIPVALMAMRLLTGILFFFQGYDKVFRLKTDGVLHAFGDALAQKNIPLPFARICILLSSLAEFIGGLLLMLGLFREPVLYMLMVDLLFVAIAFSLMKPMWDMGFYFPRFMLVLVLLVIPGEWDIYSLAHIL